MLSGELIANRFEVERFVARGGMGDVYRARDRQTGRTVAVKLLAFDDPTLVQRMSLEARALLELDHPAVVRHVAHDTAGAGAVYLAMEWLDGVTLSRRMRAQPLTVDEVLAMATRIADGLGAAHARGMVHRDVKPSNILLVDGDVRRPKVLDFGIVRLDRWQQVTATGVGMGTPEYMAPEQARCEREIGPGADVFALGCVMYKCLTGQPAFQGERIEAVLAKIAMFDAPPRVSEVRRDIPPAVDDLIARMMAYEVGDRPENGTRAAEVIRAARALLRDGQPGTSEVVLPAITRRERQPVSIIFADIDLGEGETLPSAVIDPTEPSPRDTESEGEGATLESKMEGMVVLRGPSDGARMLPRVRRALAPYGARVEVLLNGSFVAMVSGGTAATDLAARSARCALALRTLLPDASLGLATKRAVVDERQAIGPIIDSAAALVRHGSRTIAIDTVTRDLLPAQFDIAGDERAGWQLQAERARADDEGDLARPLLGRPTPCFGRNRLLRQLEAAFEGCAEDRAAEAFVVVGVAGVGKSRLRAELLRRLRADRPDLQVLSAWGDALRAQVPYGLASRSLRAAFGVIDGAPPEEQQGAVRDAIAAVAPEPDRVRLSEFLGELAAVEFPAEDSPALRAARSDPELMADQKRRAFEDYLSTRAHDPLLFVIDDLHWADLESLELIGHGLRAAHERPLMILAFARPEARDRFPTLGDLWSPQEIPLETLRPGDCEALVRETLGDRVDEPTVRRLVDRSAGNPFYLEELIRAAAAGDADALPESVVASVQMRIGRLPEPARHLLRAASVFGRTFWPGGTAALLGAEVTRRDLDHWLDALEREELITRRRDGTSLPGHVEYSFRHDLVREAAYQMLTDTDRVTGHRLAGQWLMDAGEPEAIVLAEHFAGGDAAEQALDWFERAAEQALASRDSNIDLLEALGKAAHYYRRAGETAARAHANGTAIVFFERAAALFSTMNPVEAARTRLLLARSREHVGDRRLAIDDLDRAQSELEGTTGDPRLRIEIVLERANLERRAEGEGTLERARSIAHHARDLASDLGARDLEAKALTMLAVIHTQEDTEESRAKAVSYAQMALAISRASGDLASALWRLGNALLHQSDYQRARSLYEQAMTVAQYSRDEMLQANIEANLGLLSCRTWKLDEAIERTKRARDVYERIGHHTRLTASTLNLGTFHYLRDGGEAAKILLESALRHARGDWMNTTLCQESLADLARSEGRETDAQSLLASAAQTCARVQVPQRESYYLGLLSESLWASGDYGTALDRIDQAVEVGQGATLSYALIQMRLGLWEQSAQWFDVFRNTDPDPDRRLLAHLLLARTMWWRADLKHAVAAAEDAYASVQQTGLERYLLPVRILRSCLTGDLDSAVVRLGAAQASCGQPSVAEAALDISNLVLGDRELLSNPAALEFVRLTARLRDRSVFYRVEFARSQVLAQHGDEYGRHIAAERAHQEVRKCRRAVNEDARDFLDDHPWIRSLREPQLTVT